VGTRVGWESGSLVFEPEKPDGPPGTETRFASDEIARMEISRGSKSRALLGAGIGFGVGVGLTIVTLSNGSVCNSEETCNAGDWAKGIAIFGGVGAGLGALVGLLFRTDRWEPVPWERIRVSFTPVYNGQPGLALSVRF